jgi:1-phosphatidylinositol-4-phosphate 5-kinase
MDGITPEEIMSSIDYACNKKQAFNAGQGAGASGSFFFHTYDGRFIIKSINESEKDVFLKNIDKFIEHFKSTQNKSIIARIYGIFRVQTNSFNPFNIIIMQNVAQVAKGSK